MIDICTELEKNKISKIESNIIQNIVFLHDTNIQQTLIDAQYQQLNANLLKIVNLNPIEFKISFDTSATTIIQKLFDKYVDDDTLVITTKQEHPKVNNILQKTKNVAYLIDDCHLECDNFNTLTYKCSQYKKVFVYVIGTICGTGKHIDMSVFRILKYILSRNHIQHTIVIDAVQELFLFPRDYSMFDYVIGTAHALIPHYNIGIVISKNKPFCYQLKIGEDFYELLLLVKQRQKYLDNFSNLLSAEFNDIAHRMKLKINNFYGNIFSIGDTIGTLLPIIPASMNTNFIHIRSSIHRSPMYSLIFRGTWSLFDVSYLNLVDNEIRFSVLYNNLKKFTSLKCDIT